MRFLGKYELLEQLTVGSVETFVAYPVGGGERLLVHVFALPAMIKSGLKNSDLLEYMVEMAPPALSTVVDAGRYDDGTQAYIVTQVPRDSKALPNWIEAYKAMARKQDTTTVEAPVQKLWEAGNSPQQTTAVSEEPIGDFTRAFGSPGPKSHPARAGSATDAFDLQAPAPVPGTANRSVPPDAASDQGGAARDFTSGLGEGARLSRPSAALKPLSNTNLGPAPTPPPSAIPWDAEPSSSREPSPTSSRPGEFTMFFKSPLAPSSDIPEPLVEPEPFVEQDPFRQPAASPRKGDFTQLFGSSSPAGVDTPAAEPLLEPATPKESFTNIFGRAPAPVSPPAASPTVDAQTKPELSGGYRRSLDVYPSQVELSRPPAESPFKEGTASADFMSGHTPKNDGATRLFRPTVQETQAPAPDLPPGESEYTRIISAKAKPPEAVEGPPPNQAPAAGGQPKLSIPVPPPLPPLPVPVMAVPPPVPPMPRPTPPAIQVPGIPKLSTKAPKAEGKKTSGWTAYAPLIVILNLLLLAAVSLVLYFILKH